MQCWDCKFYSVYYGRPFCARDGEMSDEETTRKCREFLNKRSQNDRQEKK